jgi:hypothetical protein
MHLDPTTAQIFIDGYKHVLSMIHSLEGLKRSGSPNDRLVAARERLAREPFLLDQALETLENRRGILVDEDVVSAIRTLDLGKCIYLRDLKHHSIFLHPDGIVGFGVVGLTQPIRDLTGGPGWLVEAGLMAYEGHFICDGLLVEAVGLGPHLRADYILAYKELKAIGAFHMVPRQGFAAPPQAQGHPATTPTGTRVEGQMEGKPASRNPARQVPSKTVATPGKRLDAKQAKVEFTPLQGQYLAFIQAYTTLHGRPPAERDMQVFFGVTAPVVHQMILGLASKGFIHREPGKARSIKPALPPERLPILVRPSRER